MSARREYAAQSRQSISVNSRASSHGHDPNVTQPRRERSQQRPSEHTDKDARSSKHAPRTPHASMIPSSTAPTTPPKKTFRTARIYYRGFLAIIAALYAVVFIVLIVYEGQHSNWKVPIEETGVATLLLLNGTVTVVVPHPKHIFDSQPLTVYAVVCVIIVVFLMLQMFNVKGCFANRPLIEARLTGHRYWLWASRVCVFSLLFPLFPTVFLTMEWGELYFCSVMGVWVALGLWKVEFDRAQAVERKWWLDDAARETFLVDTQDEAESPDEFEDDCRWCTKNTAVKNDEDIPLVDVEGAPATHVHSAPKPAYISKFGLCMSWVAGTLFWIFCFTKYGMNVYAVGSQIPAVAHANVWCTFVFYAWFMVLNGLDVWEVDCCLTFSYRLGFTTMYFYEALLLGIVAIQVGLMIAQFQGGKPAYIIP